MSEKKYSKNHEWVSCSNNIAFVGISNYAQESLGDIVFIDLPEIGRLVNAGDQVGVIESVKAANDIYSPVSGEIIEVNIELQKSPQIINEDPENTAWIFKLKIKEPSQFNDLMTLSEYQEFLKTEEK